MRADEPAGLEPDLCIMADCVADPLWVVGLGGAMLYANAPALRVTGVLRQARDLVDPADWPMLRLWLENGDMPPGEPVWLRMQRVDGRAEATPISIRRLGQGRTLLRATEPKPDSAEPPHVPAMPSRIIESHSAEQTLRTEAAWRRFMFQRSRDGIAVLDATGRLVEWNDEFQKMLGYPPEELALLSVWDWDTRLTQAQVEAGIPNLPEGGLFKEAHHRRKDGSEYDTEISTVPFDWNGARYVYSVHRDCTARKQMEAELRRSQETLSRAQAIAQTGSWLYEPGTGRLECSEEACRILAVPAGTRLTHETFSERVHPEDRLRVAAAWAEALAGHAFDLEHRVDLPDTTRWVHQRAEITRDADGWPIQLLGTVRDITERYVLHERLHRQIAFTEAVIDLEVDGVAVCHMIDEPPYVRFTLWNRAMSALTGYSMEAINRLGWYQTVYTDPRDQERARERMARLYAGDHILGELWRITRRDGEPRDIEIHTCGVLEDERGQQVLAVMRDVTEQRRQQEAARQAKQFSDDVIDSLPGLMYLLDESGRMMRWSNVAEISGYADDAIAAMSAMDFFVGDDQDRIRRAIAAAFAHGLASIEADIVGRDGRRIPFYFTARRIEIGGTAYVVGFGQDMSDLRAAAEALREREEIYSLIFNQAGDGIELTDAETLRFVQVNDTTCRLLGYTREELLGMSLVDIRADLDEATFRAMAARVRGTVGTTRFDGVHRRKDGTLLDVQVGVQAVRLRGHDYFIGIWRDISSEKAAQAALTQEAQWRRALLENVRDGIAIFGEDHRVIELNERFAQMLGYAPEDMIGKPGWEIDANMSEADIHGSFDDVLAINQTFESRHRRRDGSIYEVEVSARGVEIGDRRIVVTTSRDISERKRIADELEQYRHHLEELVDDRTSALEAAYQQLRVTDRRLKAMFELSKEADGMDEALLLRRGIDAAVRLTASQVGYLQFVNAHLEGTQPCTWSTGTLAQGEANPQDHDRLSCVGVWAEAARLGRPIVHNGDDVARADEGSPDDQPEAIRHLSVPVLEGGEVRVVLVVGKKVADYTESDAHELQLIADDLWRIVMRRRAEAALAEAKEAAEHASHAKSRFLANMSHEIRTPLNAIIGMTYLLQRGEQDPARRDKLTKIDTASQHLLQLLNDILDLAKIEEEKLGLEVIELDLARVLEDVCTLVGEKACAKRLELVVDLAPSLLGSPPLRGDPTRLTQILANFLGNAVKFTEEGAIVLRVRLEADRAEEQRIHFEIQDTGIGIAHEDLGRLFQLFEQADDSNTRRYGGSGLGLAINRQLVKLMGGEVGVRSEPGVGSTFWFTANFEKAWDAACRAAGTSSFTGRRALVVDDQPAAREALANLLQAWGIEAVTADSGETALDLLEAAHTPFDLALLDWRMPGLDGLETAHRMVALRLPSPPARLLLVTAWDDPGLNEAARSAGLTQILTKPVTPSALKSALAEALLDAAKPLPDIQSDAARALSERFHDARILLVEDDTINQEVTQRLLQGAGLNVEIANDGSEALEMGMSAPYALILMDVQMPVMDGLHATQMLRLVGFDAPILAMTANAFAEDREGCLAAGMNDFITKPVDPERLFGAILEWLSISQGHSSPSSEARPRLSQP